MVKKSNDVQNSSREAQRIARRERRREQSREEILDATLRVLKRDGVKNLTVDAVAEELDLTKAALYYYFPSKQMLMFELVYRHLMAEGEALRDAAAEAEDGQDALRSMFETLFELYSGNYDVFRLLYMHNQVAGDEAMMSSPELLERIRPFNDMAYGGAQRKLEEDGCAMNARRLAFLAHCSALGVLMFKGMVEQQGDPLLHSDEKLVDDLSRIFAAAAKAT
jgi:AcrR family transcriptional regulator